CARPIYYDYDDAGLGAMDYW
nr:immunoglobulin heavy chain junction region [Mus musculus]